MSHNQGVPGIINLGYEYEKLVPAYLSLKLLEDDSVKNFTLNVNPSTSLKNDSKENCFGKFDDLTVNITYHDGHKDQFALQLKHREAEKEKFNAEKELEVKKKKKNDFTISIYCASFETLTQEVQTDYKFILFTNITFGKIDDIQSFKVKKCADPFKVKVFNTGNIYQFQDLNTKSQTVFYKKFYLLSGQENVQAVEKGIVQIFREKFHSDLNTATCYIQFFANLRMWKYINSNITRDEVILKLTTLLLSNHIIRTFRIQRDAKIKQLEEAIQHFDVTLIQDIDQEFVKDKWCYSHRQDNLVEDWARNNKMLQEKDQLSEKEKQLIHYLMQNLVFVNVTATSEDVVYKVVDLSRSTENFKLKFVLIGKEVKAKFLLTEKKNEDQDIKKWNIFENLSQLESNQRLYSDMIMSTKLSLQGRNAECLATLKTKFDLYLDEFITPDVLFQMLEDDLVVGTPIEKLSGYYVPRILRNAPFSYKHLGAICERSTVIVECSGKSQTFGKLLSAELANLKILDLNIYQQNPSRYKKSTVVLSDQKFDHTNHSVICLQLIQHNKLAWSDNKIKEEDLNISDSQAKAIFGSPGMGKTVMMKRFANECPLNYWVVMVPVTQHRSFLKNNATTEDVLKHFLNSDKKIDKQVTKYFQRLKQILFLFDGVDELENQTITIFISVVKQLIDEGYQILIFGRTYLKEMLTTGLQIYTVYEIENLKKEDMKEYIYQHLKGKQIETKSIELIAGKILENYREEIDGNVLKVPLLLFIVLEIVSGYNNLDSLDEIPSVSKIYPRFIEGKLQHNLEKAKYNYADRSNIVISVFKRYYFREYQIAALKSCLNQNVLERLQISADTFFVQLIKDRRDFLGLITEVNTPDTFVFCHHTFAEYFVALWLSENIEKLSHEERRFIFEQKYNRVRYFFDTELAKNCPLHQAVLKQNVAEVEKLAPNNFDQKDCKGRTPLHLASSLGQKYPISENVEIRNYQNVASSQILQCLLNIEQIDPLHKDTLFQWNCFEYADASLCLLALEELSKKKQFRREHLTNYRNMINLCKHCVCLGCINILSILIKFQGLSNLDRLDKPILHMAIEYGQNEVVKFLLKNGADIMRICSKGRTPLHEAVMWGHLDILKTLLETNLNTRKRTCRGNVILQFDINKKDGRGNTPLQFAAELGNFDVIKLLTERGAQVNTTDKLGKTPLHKAARMHDINIVEYLIDNGADPIIQDNEGLTVLHQAVRIGQLEVVKYLVEKNININAVDRAKKTGLHHAAFRGLKDIVECLVEKGIDVMATDEDGKTALEIAEKRKQENIIEYLRNAERNVKRLSPKSPEELGLHELAKTGDVEKVQQLLDVDNIEARDRDNNTILHIASYYGHETVVEYLLDKGANTDATNDDDRIPLHLAAQLGHVKVVKQLLDKGYKSTAMDKWGLTPLHRAAYKGHKEVVALLLDAGFSVNSQDYRKQTPLHGATNQGHNDVIDLLISNRANVEAVCIDKKTCLHEAARTGMTETVRHLVPFFSNIINNTTTEGETALHIAAIFGHLPVIQELVAADADVNIANNYNKTALDLAHEYGQTEIEKFLQDYKPKSN